MTSIQSEAVESHPVRTDGGVTGRHAGETAGSVIIRPLASVAFLYPTVIMALICAFWVWATDASPASPGSSGILFTLVFFFNLSIMAFQYSRAASFTVCGVGGGLMILSAVSPGVRGFIHAIFSQPLYMNTAFYLSWSFLLAVLMVGVWLRGRVDYWEVTGQEVIHYRGPSTKDRWPVERARLSTHVGDLMEYALLRSGRVTLVPSGDSRAIVIDHVPAINKVETALRRILSGVETKTSKPVK